MEHSLLWQLVLTLTPSIIVGLIFVIRLEGKLNVLDVKLDALESVLNRSNSQDLEETKELKKEIDGVDALVSDLINYINQIAHAANQRPFVIRKY